MSETFARRASRLRLWLAAVALMLGVSLAAPNASGHELDSASLVLTEIERGRFRVEWQTSSAALREELAAPAVFPEPCRLAGAILDCGPRGLAGTVEFPWLRDTRTRVLVDIAFADGARVLRVVTASSPALAVYGIPASAGPRALEPVATDYVRLGVEHIATGLDHLFFVVALTFLARGTAALVGTITAFTLAHSVSLAATAFGFVAVPAAPVEAVIALSIVFVSAECLRGSRSFAGRRPAAVAFAFGLLHGFGFASALLATGLPENHVPVALFSFNLGVELGQLGVVAFSLGFRRLARRLPSSAGSFRRITLYAMGSVAAFWFFQRLAGVFERS